MSTPVKQPVSLLKSILPSSLASVCVHALIVVIAGMSLRGCEQGVPVEAGGQKFRQIGLAVINDQSTAETDVAAQNSQEDADVEQPSEVEPTSEQSPVVPTQAPSVAELLGKNPFETEADAMSNASNDLASVIGPGTPIGGAPNAGGGLPDLIRPKGKNGMGSAGSPNPGPGETTFMNIVGNGQNFVYVIDISSSMANEGRLDLARSQLKGSLRLLKPNQKFQVLFYNDSTKQMVLRKRAVQDMYVGTAVQIHLAEAEIDRVRATGGTEHKSPLLRALMLEPDVVYFLTDGDTPALTRRDLATLRSRNRSGARIHVIEFATGPRESRQPSWLEALSSQSGGAYRRINLKVLLEQQKG